jgi:rSAM/selenodomain-associated transferase 1
MSIHSILDPSGAKRVPAGLCALGIMTKAPQAGKVKTRLIPPLTATEAAELNICFLRDLSASIAQACQQSSGAGVGIFTPTSAAALYEDILPASFFLLPQRGESFGQRLIFAAEDLFTLGFKSVCLINSDSPTVSASSFAEAAIELANPGDRVVLGPSQDGGYYLIGLKKVYRRLFEQIDWSTPRVLEQTKARANKSDIPVYELPFGLDVDDSVTIAQLCDELFGDSAKLTSHIAPKTRKFLSKIIQRDGRERIWPA